MRLKDSFSCIKRISFKNTVVYTFLLKDKISDGGNSGYQQQITDIGNRINNCMRYMR